MDPDDPTSIIFTKIRTLEPENATKIIGYFLLQDMEETDLIRIAFGPDTLLQTFCRKAKSDLGLNGFSLLNPSSRPINILRHTPQNTSFLDFSRNPNSVSSSLSPSETLFENPFFASSSSGDYDPFAHKRSFSASDVCLEPEDSGFGGGTGFRFPQTGLVDDFGGFSERDYLCLQREEMMRMKLAQQQRLAAMSHEQELNFLLQKRIMQRQGSGHFGEENGYYSMIPSRHERDDSVSRQIYLTFPSDSSFTDEDVSDYFSTFGGVEDVRIPYQQQRMYGFVTFGNAETVRIILARGNPHFICDSRVLVKPYKEKGKILQNKRQHMQLQQLLERGSYSPSSSPSGMDSRDLFDCHLGPRMFSSNTQEILRRKAEQQADSELQQAIEMELQRRRFLNLQLPERENESFRHFQRSLSIGSPAHFPPRFNQSHLFQSEINTKEITEGDWQNGEKHLQFGENSNGERGYSNDIYKRQESGLSLEDTLPDSLFGSPKKSSETYQTESDTEQTKTA